MARQSAQQDFVAHVVDLLQALGPVYSRRMFGGHGVFLDGMMFALIVNHDLFFKVDDDNRADFEAEGLTPFTYQSQGKSRSLSYYQAPEEVLESLDIMRDWGNRGFAAALRAAARKSRRS